MPQDRSSFYAGLRTCVRAAVVAVAPALLLIANAAWAGPGGGKSNGGGNGGNNEGNNDRGAVRLLTLIPVPVTAANNTAGGLYSFDISFVDQNTQTYYLADRSNKVVDVVDASMDTFAGQIAPTSPFAPFAGFVPCVPAAGANDCSGPNGVVAAFPWLFVTDAPSRVLSIDLRTGKTVSQATTKVGEPTRADELAYDPTDGLLLVVNNAATPPFATLISVNQTTGVLTVGTNITLDAAHGVDARNGAEQPVWNPATGKFYLSIPQIGATVSHGGVLRISTTGTVETTYGVELCGPAGLTLGPGNDLLIGCNTVFDTAGNVWNPSGTVAAAPKDVILNVQTGSTTDVPGVGAGDEVWFNAGDGNYYATGSGSPLRPLLGTTAAAGSTPLGVIDAEDRSLLQLVPTYNVPAGTGHPAGTAHSVAANASNNHVFVPLAANNAFLSPDGSTNCLKGCIAVFAMPSKSE